MKQTERSFDATTFKRKQIITPSTAYSFSESPQMEVTESDLLTRNLAALHRKLAEKLKKQAHYLALQVPVLQHRSDFFDLKLEKLRNNREILENTLKTFQKLQNPKIFTLEIEKLEENNEQNMQKTLQVEKEVKVLKKKQRDVKRLEKKEIILNEKSRVYSEELQKFKVLGQQLSENLLEIRSGQVKIVEIFHLSKEKLEHLMVSKEELLLSIPLLQLPKEKFEVETTEIEKIKSQNFHLRQIFSSLVQDLRNLTENNLKGRKDFEKCLQNFHSREVLMKVQARYLEEKKARNDFVRSELASIEKALSQVQNEKSQPVGSKPSRIQSFPRPLGKLNKSLKSPRS